MENKFIFKNDWEVFQRMLEVLNRRGMSLPSQRKIWGDYKKFHRAKKTMSPQAAVAELPKNCLLGEALSAFFKQQAENKGVKRI